MSKQVLLILTDEPWLDETTLSEYLKTIKLQRPRYCDGIFVMASLTCPTEKGDGHYPIFEAPWQDRKVVEFSTSNPVGAGQLSALCAITWTFSGVASSDESSRALVLVVFHKSAAPSTCISST